MSASSLLLAWLAFVSGTSIVRTKNPFELVPATRYLVFFALADDPVDQAPLWWDVRAGLRPYLQCFEPDCDVGDPETIYSVGCFVAVVVTDMTGNGSSTATVERAAALKQEGELRLFKASLPEGLFKRTLLDDPRAAIVTVSAPRKIMVYIDRDTRRLISPNFPEVVSTLTRPPPAPPSEAADVEAHSSSHAGYPQGLIPVGMAIVLGCLALVVALGAVCALARVYYYKKYLAGRGGAAALQQWVLKVEAAFVQGGGGPTTGHAQDLHRTASALVFLGLAQEGSTVVDPNSVNPAATTAAGSSVNHAATEDAMSWRETTPDNDSLFATQLKVATMAEQTEEMEKDLGLGTISKSLKARDDKENK